MTGPRYTVAICTRNRAALLRLCLDALAVSLRDREVPVVLVDNASTDGTAGVAAEAAVPVTVVREGRLGLSHARNAALEACRTEYLVFLDDDATPLPGWAAAIEGGLEQWGPDFFGGPYRPLYLDPRPDWFDDRLGSAHLDHEPGLQPAGTCFSGGNMGWRTDLLREAGGFDPELGMVGDTLRLGEETQIQLQYYADHPDARAVFLPGMEMLHYVPPYKMRVGYWWRRAWDYGWRLPEIDPNGEVARMSSWELLRDTKAGLPLLLRAVHRDRRTYPTWASFAVAYGGGRSGVLGGYLARKLFRPA